MTLRLQLLAWFGMLVACMALLAGSWTVYRTHALVQQGLESRADGLAEVIAGPAALGLAFEDPEYLTRELQKLGAVRGVDHAAVYDRSGKAVAVFGGAPGAAPRVHGTQIQVSEAYVRSWVALDEGAVVVGLGRGEARQAQRGNLRSGVLIGSALGIGGTLVVWLIGARLASPIERLANLAHRSSITRADLKALAAGSGGIGGVSEVTRLGRTMADLASRVLGQIEILQERARALEAERAALDASQAKSRFMANMSHELRTPLNAILGYTELLQDDAADRGEAHTTEDLSRIGSAARHLLAIVDQVLDLEKVESGANELSCESIDLAATLSQVIEEMRPVVEANHNTLHIDICGLDQVIIDRTKLRQCVMNLLSNASKFTRHGEVTVQARQVGDAVLVTVRDTGIGMDESQQLKIFERFVRLAATSGAHGGGSGLGLTLVRRYARMMGGDVRVRSEAGKGSTFELFVRPMVPQTGLSSS